MNNLVDSLSKYTGVSAEQLQKAFDAIENSVREDVEDHIYKLTGIGYSEDELGNAYKIIEPDDFLEWLFDNYDIKEKQ